MRAYRRSLTLLTLGLSPVACAVYDDGTLGLGSMSDPSAVSGAGATKAGAGPNGGGPSVSGTAGSGTAMGGTFDSGGSGGNAGKAGASAGTAGQITTSLGGDDGGGDGDGGETTGGSTTAGKGGSGTGGTGTAGAAGHGGVASGNGGNAGSSGSASGGGVSSSGGASASGGVSGTAGTGGMPSPPLCSDHPLTARASWIATASIYDSDHGGVPANVLDNKTTRWSTGAPQTGDEWLQIDFGATVTLDNINLQQGSDTNDYPRAYSVIVSAAAKDLSGTVRVNGSGKSGASTAIVLPALASGRYLLIKQTGSSLSWWSAEEIEVSCSD